MKSRQATGGCVTGLNSQNISEISFDFMRLFFVDYLDICDEDLTGGWRESYTEVSRRNVAGNRVADSLDGVA